MKLFIRTQASPAIGVGHFMRCLAIAEEARAQGIAVCFLMEAVEASLQARLRMLDIVWEIVTGPLGSDATAVADRVGDNWLIVDSYRATSDYLAALDARTRLVVMDDLADFAPLSGRIVVNAAQSAADMPYDRIAPQAVKLLGPAYAPVRAEFRRVAEPGSGIAVMFGGSDPFALSEPVLAAIRSVLPEVPVRLIVGPANPRRDILLALTDTCIDVIVDPADVAGVLAGSDLVVTAAGGSVNEIAALGLPALAVVVADNQAAWLSACPFPVVDARGGLPSDFADRVHALCADPDLRRRIAAEAHVIVDGQGAARIVAAIKSL